MAREVNAIRLTVDLHKAHSLVTTSSNVPGAMTKILTVTPGDNQILYWPNDLPILLKLYTAMGAEIEAEAELSLYKVWPGRIKEELLGSKSYSSWRNIAFADQSDPEREANLAIPFHESAALAATIPPGYWLELRLKSDSTVSWAYANTQFFAGVGQQIIP